MTPARRVILAGIAIFFAGCSQDRPRIKSELAEYHPPGTGPFDSRGNYIESWADRPSQWRGRSVPRPPSSLERQVAQTTSPEASAPQSPAPAPQASTPQPSAIAARTPPPTKATTPPPKPAPKPQAVKVVPKKPAPVRVTVKRGDTLYGLSLRYKATVAAIKKANGLKSDMIRPGQKLVMPR